MTRFTARLIVASGIALAAGASGTEAHSQQPKAAATMLRTNGVTATTVLAIEHWIDAVENHTPGAPDAAVANVWAMSPDARKELGKGLKLFLAGLSGKGVTTASDAEKRVATLGADKKRDPGATAFLDRAAVLHADAAMFGRLVPVPPASASVNANQNSAVAGSVAIAPRSATSGLDRPAAVPPSSGRLSSKPTDPVSALFPVTQSVITNDAEYGSVTENNWNWTFARSLLDLVQLKPSDDPFVATWYHATTAYLQGQSAFGEAGGQLARAAVVLPDDARILFDRGCFTEEMGLPQAQALLTDDDLLALRLKKSGTPMRNPPKVSAMAELAGIPPAEVANSEAEGLFRRVLELNPTFVEARVRLARLLEIRKRYAEADALLTTAIETSRDPWVTFHAHLFAARADHALGKNDLAATHIRAALALFPNAQSALMAQSQLALLTANPTSALTPIRLLASMPTDTGQRSDPWWLYPIGAGRDTHALLADMWANVKH
jgi:hypothetical protein